MIYMASVSVCCVPCKVWGGLLLQLIAFLHVLVPLLSLKGPLFRWNMFLLRLCEARLVVCVVYVCGVCFMCVCVCVCEDTRAAVKHPYSYLVVFVVVFSLITYCHSLLHLFTSLCKSSHTHTYCNVCTHRTVVVIIVVVGERAEQARHSQG